MKVSVIIPVYNNGTGLHRTIRSVLYQTHKFIEVIIVDDGSSDDSFLIAKQYENANIKVIRQTNAGAAVARNTGLAAASGAFVQFLDAGDVISADKIEKQVAALQQTPGKLAVCGYKQFTTDDELQNGIYPNQHSFIYSTNDPVDFLVRLWGGEGSMNFIQTNCWLVPRALIEKAGYWRAYRCPDDDGEFFARVLLASDGIVYVPGVYNYYHIAPGGINQLSRNRNRKYLQNTLLTIDLKHTYLQRNGGHPNMNRAIASQYFRFAVDMYPAEKKLSVIAYRRYRQLQEKVDIPVLGGGLIEVIKTIFGWRAARFIRYYLRRS